MLKLMTPSTREALEPCSLENGFTSGRDINLIPLIRSISDDQMHSLVSVFQQHCLGGFPRIVAEEDGRGRVIGNFGESEHVIINSSFASGQL